MTKCTERELLEELVKATQPMDFCHVCLCAHSNFKDASDHKEWCAWAKADAFLADTPACDAEKVVLVAALQKYGAHGSGCLAISWKRGDNEYRCDCGLDAAVAAALADLSPAAAAREPIT